MTLENNTMAAFRARFGTDFSAKGNAYYKVASARTAAKPSELSPAEAAALLDTRRADLKLRGMEESVDNAISTTDDAEVSVRTLQMTSGEPCVAITYHLGDTLCGLVLEAERRIAVISDSFLDPVASA